LQEFVSQYGDIPWQEPSIRERTADLAKAVYNVAAAKSAYS
jgi:hypothetical protein